MKFTDKNGIELDISDRVILARPTGTSSAELDVVTIVKFHEKSKRVTVRPDGEDAKAFVTNYFPDKFWKLAGI